MRKIDFHFVLLHLAAIILLTATIKSTLTISAVYNFIGAYNEGGILSVLEYVSKNREAVNYMSYIIMVDNLGDIFSLIVSALISLILIFLSSKSMLNYFVILSCVILLFIFYSTLMSSFTFQFSYKAEVFQAILFSLISGFIFWYVFTRYSK